MKIIMNEIINKFLLVEDNFMPEIHLIQPTQLGKPGFPYSACEPYTQNKERIKNLKKLQIQDTFIKAN